MLSFAKFRLNIDIFDTAVFCALYAIRTGVFPKEFLLTPVLYLCFAIRTGVFFKGILADSRTLFVVCYSYGSFFKRC